LMSPLTSCNKFKAAADSAFPRLKAIAKDATDSCAW
jgi:hypothetical protein